MYQIKHQVVKTYGGAEEYLHAFLTSPLDGGEASASHPGHFTPGADWLGGWAGRRTSVEMVDRRKILCRESSPGRPVRSLVTMLTVSELKENLSETEKRCRSFGIQIQ